MRQAESGAERADFPYFNGCSEPLAKPQFLSDHPDDQDLHFPFLNQSAGIDPWVKMLTSGLVWSVTGSHATGSSWGDAWVWSPSYYPGRRGEPLTLDSFLKRIDLQVYRWQQANGVGKWRPGWQPHPHAYPSDHFRFGVCLDEFKYNSVVHFRLVFFGSHPYFVSVRTSKATMETIDRFLVAEADRRERNGIPPDPEPVPPRRPC